MLAADPKGPDVAFETRYLVGTRLPTPGRSGSRRSAALASPAAAILLAVISVGPAAAQVPERDARPVAFGPLSWPVTAPPPETSLPGNLVLPDVIRPLATTMWRQSITFRRQCARLAERPDVIVRIELAVGVQDARARSRVDRHEVGRNAAVQVEWRNPALYVEYIAHELEHVLEQMDGTDLPRLARQRVHGVRKLGDEYETARARSVGQTVAREVLR